MMHEKTKKAFKMKKERGVFVIEAYVPKSPEQGSRRPR